jgi:hypothetical protein
MRIYEMGKPWTSADGREGPTIAQQLIVTIADDLTVCATTAD